MAPLVTVIIPTHARPHLVPRAVRTVLGQTLQDLELIVVLDGPDPDTHSSLAAIADPRLRIEVMNARGGQAAAINAGVAQASGAWIALLDDDDEWMPEKLDLQLQAATASDAARPVIGCRFIARSAAGDLVWPRRAPHREEPVWDYLFCRSQLAFGEGILPTSTLFASAGLFREVPLDESLRKHCDIDWLLRVGGRPDVQIALPADLKPLSIWNLEGGDRLSKAHNWRDSRRWILARRERISRRACAGFLLNWAGTNARNQRDATAIPLLLADAFRHGRPGSTDLLAFAALWILPPAVRGRWSRRVARRNPWVASP